MLAANIQKSAPHFAEKEPYEVFLEIVEHRTPLGREQTPGPLPDRDSSHRASRRRSSYTHLILS